MPSIVRAVGIPWYSREDYARILAVMEDAQVLPATWEEWFKRAEQGRDQLRAQGHIVEQVHIDPDGFPAWCRAHGLNVNASGRMAFANAEVGKKFGSTN